MKRVQETLLVAAAEDYPVPRAGQHRILTPRSWNLGASLVGRGASSVMRLYVKVFDPFLNCVF